MIHPKANRRFSISSLIEFSRCGRLARCENGNSAIEIALVLPVFLMLLVGMLQIGMVTFLQNNMSLVANDLSRRLAVGELTPVDAVAAAELRLINWGIDYAVQVRAADPADPTAWGYTVVIAAPMEQAALFDILGMLQGNSISATATMRLEG